MKETTDACLFGAWIANDMNHDLKDRRDGPDWKDGQDEKRLLDIGTGTGLLSLMIAQKNNFLIDAVEIEEKAAEQARENVYSSPWRERINIINKNIKEYKADKKYKYIISNPPFYENELEGERMEKNMAHHDAGLKMSELLEYINLNLEKDGSFYLLLPAKRENEIEKIIEAQNLFISKKIIVKQSTQHSPFRIMIKGSHQPTQIITSELSITEASNKYNGEFIELLKEYYLYL